MEVCRIWSGLAKLVPCQSLARRKLLTEGNHSFTADITYPVKYLNVMCVVDDLPNCTDSQQI